MKQKSKFWILLMCAVTLFIACDDNNDNYKKPIPKPIDIKLTAKETKIATASRDMSMKFLNLIAKEIDEKKGAVNFMVSPYSLNAALSMLWNGAEEETKIAIGKTLGLDAVAIEDANSYYKKITTALLKTDPTSKMAIANSIWHKKSLTLNTDFQKVNKKWYDAQVEGVDFSASATKDKMNKWCSDKTNGRIKNVIENTPADVVMYLMNALYFKGMWSKANSFDKNKTKMEDFTLEDKSKVKVAMMQREARLNFVENEALSAVELPYGNGAYSMVFMLPKEGTSLSGMLTKLSETGYFPKNMGTWKMHDVKLALPKFKVKNKHSLKEVLKQMGMGIAFDGSKANLKSLFSPAVNCAVSKVEQFTYLDVDEKGTEAAAVTVVGVLSTSAVEVSKATFLANRPFVFVIKENSTNCVLFSGKIGNPSVTD